MQNQISFLNEIRLDTFYGGAMVSASIVLYNTKKTDIDQLLDCIIKTPLIEECIVIDHSKFIRTDISLASNIKYYHIPKNPGYGIGHNTAISLLAKKSKYHLILNPDISFESVAIENIIGYLENHEDVGQLMPKILNPDNSIQNLARLIPTPLNLISRRLSFSLRLPLLHNLNNTYELNFIGHNSIEEVPILSGCFMALRMDVFKKVGGFDPVFFMYLEDYDLTRRMGKVSKVIYYPLVSIIHNHARESYKSIKLMRFHIISAIKYFNKWGWLNDKDRRKINSDFLRRIKRIE